MKGRGDHRREKRLQVVLVAASVLLAWDEANLCETLSRLGDPLPSETGHHAEADGGWVGLGAVLAVVLEEPEAEQALVAVEPEVDLEERCRRPDEAEAVALCIESISHGLREPRILAVVGLGHTRSLTYGTGWSGLARVPTGSKSVNDLGKRSRPCGAFLRETCTVALVYQSRRGDGPGQTLLTKQEKQRGEQGKKPQLGKPDAEHVND